MSKQFLRGRRGSGGKIPGIFSKALRIGHVQGQGDEKQRPSVFERLGTRRVNPPSFVSTDEGPNRTKNYTARSTERAVNIGGGGRLLDTSGRLERPRGRSSRSRSPFLKHKVKPPPSSSDVISRKINLKSVVANSSEERAQRSSPPRKYQETSAKLTSRKESLNLKSRSKTGDISLKKSEKEKLGSKKTQSTSSGGEETPDESSTSTSRSTSSTEGSSSSSSEGSSSSESSAPSIKLKPAKKKMKKTVARKSTDHERLKEKKEAGTTKKQLRPEAPAIASKNRDVKRSPLEHGRLGAREPDNDGKRYAPARSKRPERDADQYDRNAESRPGHVERRAPSQSRGDRDEVNRKRKLPQDNNVGPNKRIRTRRSVSVERVKSASRGTPTTPQMPPSSKRDRSPLPSGRGRGRAPPRVTSPVPKRALLEDIRRVNLRHDEKTFRRSPAMARERSFPRNLGNTLDSPNKTNFREDRHRERFAPSREAPSQSPRDRIPALHERDRRSTGSRDKDSTGLRRAPHFQDDRGPYFQASGVGNKSPIGLFQRGLAGSNFTKHSPLIVRTKEALMEKYDEIRQSRVDMWVDETLRGGPSPRQPPIPLSAVKVEIGNRSSPVPLHTSKKSNSAEAESEKGIDFEVDELSDFSDDADDLLTKEPAAPPVDIVGDISAASTKTKTEAEAIVKTVKSTDSDLITVSSSGRSRDVSHSKPGSVRVTTTTNPALSELRSQSQSQTDEDLLEQMDFEEISDEELGETENKVGIVDALGVDWSSLVCREKPALTEGEHGGTDNTDGRRKLKEKWSAANILKEIGISRQLAGNELFSKVFNKISEMEERNGVEGKTTKEELERPALRRKRLERKRLIEDVGIGPDSRVLSGRRDLALRRYLLNMVPKSLVAIDLFHQNLAPRSH